MVLTAGSGHCDGECEREITVTVTGAAPDPWVVRPTVTWIKIIKNTLNQQGGTVTYRLGEHPGNLVFLVRRGGVDINGKLHKVNQWPGKCRSSPTGFSCANSEAPASEVPDTSFPVIGLVFAFFQGGNLIFDQSYGTQWAAITGQGGLGETFSGKPGFPLPREAAGVGTVGASVPDSPASAAAPRRGVSRASANLAGRTRALRGADLQVFGLGGIEAGGAARGAWSQAYNSNGKRLWNFFSGKKFTALRTIALDTDGRRNAELLLLGRQDNGVRELQLRSDKGALRDRKTVGAAGTRRSQVFGVEYDGKRGDEIAITTVAKNGSGHLTVWGTSASGKKLQKLAEHAVIGAKTAVHQWLPLDTDNDGTDEMAAAYSGSSGKGSTLRIVDPRSGEVLFNKRILSTGFDGAVWRLGDYDPDRPGAELLVGYRKKSKGFFKVLAGNGAQLSKSGSIAGDPLHGWGTIRSRPGPKGAITELVFVGLTRPNGDAAFEIWDASRKKAKRVGDGTVADKEYEVLSWHAGDFDGNPDTGDEVVVVTRHLGDGNVGFQMFGRDGKAQGNRIQVFDGSYAQVRTTEVVFARKGRIDLALMARTFDGQPEVHVWNVNGGALIKKINVLSADVY